MTFDDFSKCLLSLLSWREERSNGVNGMLGVMFVVRNRVKAKWFGGDYLQNIASHNQFSSMTVVGDSQTVKYPPVNDPQFTQALQLVDEVCDPNNPRVDTLTNGALYYADLNNPTFTKGGWFEVNILNQPGVHPRSAQIGTTTYFK
jgi:Cell Wall Hydrolase